MTETHIDKDDPRYEQWKKIYSVIVDATPPALREVMEPSAGTLASRMTVALFPEDTNGGGYLDRDEAYHLHAVLVNIGTHRGTMIERIIAKLKAFSK